MANDKKSTGFTSTGEQYIAAVYEKLPPQDKESVQRAVIAGLKLMFSPQTHKYMLDSLNKEGDIAEKLSNGMMQLITILLQKTKGNIPPNVMIPAAAIMLVNACEYVEKTGGEMNTAIFSEALKMLNGSISIKVKEAQQGQGEAGAPEAAQPTAQPAAQAGGLMSAPVAA
jgi:hypothetical protein